MYLVFADTPPFAVPSHEALLRAVHVIRAVYPQPARPAGRGRKLMASAVKQYAQKHGIEIRQPEKIAGEEGQLRADAPDAMIIIAYGLLLPESILAIPRYGCINVHASLLPRWRGAAPIPRAIEAGDADTGVSIMQMEAGLDTGPVLAEARLPIHDNDTAQTLHDRLAQLGADTLVNTLERRARGEIRPQPQDASRACYAKKLRKEESALDWTQPAAVLHRKIRALVPWPVTNTTWRGKTLRLWEAGPLVQKNTPGVPGTVVQADAAGVCVLTGEPLAAGDRMGDEAHNTPAR